jgi:hypothetical protein
MLKIITFMAQQSVRAMDLLEHMSEKDQVRCARQIRAIQRRSEIDRAYVQYARDYREAMLTYLDTSARIDAEAEEAKEIALTRMVENLPASPRVENVWSSRKRRLVTPPDLVSV